MSTACLHMPSVRRIFSIPCSSLPLQFTTCLAMTACTNCRQDIESDDQFCPFCGAAQRVVASVAAATSSPADSSGGRRISTFTPRSGAGIATPSSGGTLGTRLLERVRRATAGRFDVIRLLGHGGMAAVYMAHDLRLDRQVALKVMLPALELSTGMTEKFLDEARRTARLSHPNIVVVHDVVELDDLVFIVMNLVNGATLEQAVPWLPTIGAADARKLNIAVVQTVLRQVAAGLEFAHEMGIIHRDVKPSNVMVTLKGDIVVSDFGVAKVMSGAPQEKSSLLMGTPTYMSPEQCRGLAVSGASDQYSLGVMAYELLTGTPPFVGERLQVQNAHVDRDPVPLRKLRPDIPGNLARTVTKMLAKSPRDRYDSMADVMEAISIGLDANDQQPRRLLSVAATQARSALGDIGTKSLAGESLVAPQASAVPTIINVLAPHELAFGQSFKVTAEVFAAEGGGLSGSGITFASDTPSVISVEAWSGSAIAIGAGTARVSATLGDARGYATVKVHPAEGSARRPGPDRRRTLWYVGGGIGAVLVVLAVAFALRSRIQPVPQIKGIFSEAAIAAVTSGSLEFSGPVRTPDLNAIDAPAGGESRLMPIPDASVAPARGIALRATIQRDIADTALIGGLHLYTSAVTGYLISWSWGAGWSYRINSIGTAGVELVPATIVDGTATDSLGIDVLVSRDQLQLFVNGRAVGSPIHLDEKINGKFGLLVPADARHRVRNLKVTSLQEP